MLISFENVNRLINEGKVLLLAGDETLLKELQAGSWIGGTTPYFIGEQGGCFSRDLIFVNDLTEYIESIEIKYYNEENIESICKDNFNEGFSYLLMPVFSQIHQVYSQIAETIPGLFNNPVIGWVTGVALEDMGKTLPMVFNGQEKTSSAVNAIAMHAKLKPGYLAHLDIINIFEPGNELNLIFEKDGFTVEECYVNGIKTNLASYLLNNNTDFKLPIIANYSGAYINISFRDIDPSGTKTNFYASVRSGIEYSHAKPIENYTEKFGEMIMGEKGDIVASCNCFLNYLYGGLNGEKTGNITGPVTFGEIAYVLVNQTMVNLHINKK